MRVTGLWLYAAAFVLVFMVISFSRGRGDSVNQAAGAQFNHANTVTIGIANSSAKEAWLQRAVDTFNAAAARDTRYQIDGKPIRVEVIKEVIDGKKTDYRSGSMVSDTIDGRIKPTVLSPADETWIAKLNREWRALHNTAATTGAASLLARTPLVVTMWQSRAQALGCWPAVEERCTWATLRALATSPDGWGMVGQPAWRQLKLGYGYVGESNSGTLGTVALCMLGVGKTAGLTLDDVSATNGCGQQIAAFESAKVHSGTKSDWLLGQMLAGGPEYLDAIFTNETEVIAFNRLNGTKLREPLVAVYPRDGTIIFGHPYAILDGVPWVTPEQVAAAKVFREFLLGRDQQESLVEFGLRPGDPSVKVGPPIETANGANPHAVLNLLELPEPLVIDRVIETWREVKKPAAIALVFDKSGSMSGVKIHAAVAGAQAFIGSMDRRDWLNWIPFDERVYSGARGPKGEIGEGIAQEIGGTTAGGGTALFDAILVASDTLETLRRDRGDAYRYGIVVLSDGQDTSSKNSLSQVEARLRPSEVDPKGIQIHTIAIGKDADANTLTKIANSAHGKFWKGATEKDMVSTYQSIATYY